MSHGRLGGGGVPVGDADGEEDVEVDGVADGVALAVAVAVGVGVPLLMPPVHSVPLSVKAVGAGLLPFQDPLNPKLVLPPVAMEPLYEALVTVTLAPDWV